MVQILLFYAPDGKFPIRVLTNVYRRTFFLEHMTAMIEAPVLPSLTQLYQQHRPELIRHLYRIVRCEHTAEDLMQETILRVAGLDLEYRLEKPKAFLFRTATNLALDYLRRQKVRNHLELSDSLIETLASNQPSLEHETFDRQRLEIFISALDTLPPRCRQVFVLHRLNNLSYSEIAEHLGISQSAVEKHIIRALAKCHAFLKEHDAGR